MRHDIRNRGSPGAWFPVTPPFHQHPADRRIAKYGNSRLDYMPAGNHGFRVIRSFGDKQTAKIFQGDRSRTLPPDIQSRANMKLFRIDQATQLEQLILPPSNRLESLAGDLKGFWSIRINQQWRILFRWSDGDAHDVRIADYH